MAQPITYASSTKDTGTGGPYIYHPHDKRGVKCIGANSAREMVEKEKLLAKANLHDFF